MNYCLMCGKTDAVSDELCSACRVKASSIGADPSLDITRTLQNTSVPDMISKGVNYSIEPSHLMAIQDILVEVDRLEKGKNNILASARMYHLLGNFFSVFNNPTKALENYDKALRISFDNLLVLRERIRVLELLGRDDEAKNEKAKLIQIQQGLFNPPTPIAQSPPVPPPRAPPPTSPPSTPPGPPVTLPSPPGTPPGPPMTLPSPPGTPPGPPVTLPSPSGTTAGPPLSLSISPSPPPVPPMEAPPPTPISQQAVPGQQMPLNEPAPAPPGAGIYSQTPPLSAPLSMPPSDSGTLGGPTSPQTTSNTFPPADTFTAPTTANPSGPYNSPAMQVPSKYSYKTSLLAHQSQQFVAPHEQTQEDSSRVNARIQEVFQWIGKLSSSGISTTPALEMLQKAQEYISSSNPTEAMNTANSAVAWCESALKEHEERYTSALVECQNLISNAAKDGIGIEEVRREMELAINAYQTKNYSELNNHMDSIKNILSSQMNMGRYNALLKEMAQRINTTKEKVGQYKVSMHLDEILSAAAENLVAGRFDDLARLIENGNQILLNIEEMEENIRELPILKGEVNTIRESGGDVEEISHELSLAEDMIGIDKPSFMMHFDNGKAMIKRIKENLKEDYLSRLLSERRSDIDKLRELGMDVSIPESILGNVISQINQREFTNAQEGLGRISGEILACYSGELGNLGAQIEQAQRGNIPIPNVDEYLSNTVNALNSQDIASLAYHFSTLKRSVNDSLLSLNSNAALEELFADLQRYMTILGENKTVREIMRLLERVKILLERGEQEGAKVIIDQSRTQLDGLRDLAEVFEEISKLRAEIDEGNYPEEAVKDVKRELTIAERMLDTNIGFARNYVNNAKSMMEEVRSKFMAERNEGHLMKCQLDIEKLETEEVDRSFAKALYDKISDISKEERYEEAEVLFEKLDEEIADLESKVLMRNVQDRMVKIQTRMATMAAEGVDLSEHNELLNTAIQTMQWGEIEKVASLLDEIETTINDQTSYKEVVEELKSIRRELNELEKHGVDIKKAEIILMNARPELERENYDLVKKCSKECREMMKECREQKELLETLEHLYEEIEEARRARINVTRAMELTESAKNDIMKFNFHSASDSIDNARESIRESVRDFHELTELVKLSRLKIDETREIGADISRLEAQYNDMMELVSGGRYNEAKLLSKSIVERSLSEQLSYITSKRRLEPPSPPPPAPSEPMDESADKIDLPPLYETEKSVPLSTTPFPGIQAGLTDRVKPVGSVDMSAYPPPIIHTQGARSPPQRSESVISARSIPSPATSSPSTPIASHPIPTISRPMNGSSAGSEVPADSTTDLLAEIRNIYSKLDSTTITCPYCSGEIPRDSTFCSQCGKGLK